MSPHLYHLYLTGARLSDNLTLEHYSIGKLTTLRCFVLLLSCMPYMSDLHTKWLVYYQRFSFFLVRAACMLRLMSYASKHTLLSLFDTPYCAYLHTQLKNYRSYKNALPIEQLLYYRRYLFSGLELYERYDWRVIDPNTHCNHFLILHFVHFLCDRVFTHIKTFQTCTPVIGYNRFAISKCWKNPPLSWLELHVSIPLRRVGCLHRSKELGTKSKSVTKNWVGLPLLKLWSYGVEALG